MGPYMTKKINKTTYILERQQIMPNLLFAKISLQKIWLPYLEQIKTIIIVLFCLSSVLSRHISIELYRKTVEKNVCRTQQLYININICSMIADEDLYSNLPPPPESPERQQQHREICMNKEETTNVVFFSRGWGQEPKEQCGDKYEDLVIVQKIWQQMEAPLQLSQ